MSPYLVSCKTPKFWLHIKIFIPFAGTHIVSDEFHGAFSFLMPDYKLLHVHGDAKSLSSSSADEETSWLYSKMYIFVYLSNVYLSFFRLIERQFSSIVTLTYSASFYPSITLVYCCIHTKHRASIFLL